MSQIAQVPSHHVCPLRVSLAVDLAAWPTHSASRRCPPKASNAAERREKCFNLRASSTAAIAKRSGTGSQTSLNITASIDLATTNNTMMEDVGREPSTLHASRLRHLTCRKRRQLRPKGFASYGR
ncbi:hypothetical protein EJ03DRAFT_58666 [Teratosphaeria nubilosa]|uniref:Uncharacterized protein n=1 Tax=Teratosphaeria nubilosa TaxID=161662 RepID=A0A6G1KSS2_9PEZI|nr:hypothetical protein EJ03DRAFT_58666 [Teratosphaeria nubilosa]